MIKRFLLLLSVLLPISSGYAGTVFFRHFLPEDGLAHPAVLSIAQDSLGRLWFGTENGISIYDGSSFSSIKPEGDGNTEGCYNGTIIYDILCTGDGDVFFRTEEELVRYETRTGRIDIVYNKPVSSIFIEDGSLYAIDNNRLLLWRPDNGKFDYIRTLRFKNITHCMKDGSGRKWFVCQDGVYFSSGGSGFYGLSGATAASKGSGYTKIYHNADIYSIFESSDGIVWIGSRQDGLIRVAKDGTIKVFSVANSSSKGFHSDDVRQITEDKNGRIWFGTFNGLYSYNKENDSFTPFMREEKEGSLSHSSVYSVFTDNSGTLWVGTYYGGVNYADISRNAFYFYPAADNNDGLSHPVVGHLTEDKEGNIWICTEGGGLNMLDVKSGKIEHFRSSVFPYALPHTNLKWLDYDKDNDLLYIGTTSKGLYSFDIRHRNFKNIIGEEEAGKAMAFINIVVRHGCRLFLSTREGVYVHYIETGRDSLLYRNADINFYPLAINGGELYIGSDKIYSYDINTLRLSGVFEFGVAGRNFKLLNIFAAPDNTVYATTFGHGIFKYDKEENAFKTFIDNSSPLLNNYCYQMGFSRNGHLIVSGEKGLNIISRSGKILDTYLLGNNIPLTAIVRDCGLMAASDGTIYAGGTNGLLAFEERALPSEKYREGLYFSELYINGRLIKPTDGTRVLAECLPFTDKIRLNHSQGRIEIKFASKYNAADFNITDYEYRLSGYDDSWYQMVNDRITYTNLRPGRYALELRNRYNGTEENISCGLGIRVLRAWYASWAAILLYIIIVMAITYYIVRDIKTKAAAEEEILRERREKQSLMELNEAKLRFFTSISHELKTPLTIMSGHIDTILHGYKLPPSVYNRMLKVTQQTKQLGRLVSDLIEFRKYEQDKVVLRISECNMNDFATDIYSSFTEVAERGNIDFTLSLAEDDAVVLIDCEKLERVIMNLLSNAFKFTPNGGKVVLAVSSDADMVRIDVKDTGIGIATDELDRIFERFYMAGDGRIRGSGIGLSLAKDIVEMHHGTIGVSSKVGEGSDFTITLRKGQAHFEGDPKVIFEPSEARRQQIRTDISDRRPESDSVRIAAHGTNTGQNTVLVVEDNPELIDILYELLSPLYRTLKADNGKDALEIVKAERPDLVVSDILMPVMSGTELCSAIKSDIDLCHIPVVLLTALDMPQQQLTGLLQGADDYIGKPFDTKLLLARCNNIIRNRKNLLKQIGRTGKSDISMLATNKLDKEFLDRLSEILENNVGNINLNNDLIAEQMNMSRASFYNKFKSLTGETPNEYINNFRLSKATSMLVIEQSMSVAEIADTLGFNSANYFSRKFKEKFGVSPLQYRQEKPTRQ